MKLFSGVLKNSGLGKQFKSVAINLPPPRTVNDYSFDPLPYCFVGDKISTSKTWLMRSYPEDFSEEQHVYNLRQSHQEE